MSARNEFKNTFGKNTVNDSAPQMSRKFSNAESSENKPTTSGISWLSKAPQSSDPNETLK